MTLCMRVWVPVLESPVEGEEPMDEVSGDAKAIYER